MKKKILIIILLFFGLGVVFISLPYLSEPGAIKVMLDARSELDFEKVSKDCTPDRYNSFNECFITKASPFVKAGGALAFPIIFKKYTDFSFRNTEGLNLQNPKLREVFRQLELIEASYSIREQLKLHNYDGWGVFKKQNMALKEGIIERLADQSKNLASLKKSFSQDLKSQTGSQVISDLDERIGKIEAKLK